MSHLGDTNKMVMDTPRTDARRGFHGWYTAVDAEFSEKLERELNAANDRINHLHNGIEKQNQTIEQACGKALGYPWFKDDQKTFPGATENDGVCVAGHFAETIVWELVGKYTYALDHIKRLEEAGDGLSMWVCPEYKSDPANIALQNWRKAKEDKL